MAKIVWTRPARENFFALADRYQDAVRSLLTMLEGDPELGHRLRGRLRGLRSLRIGSFRLLYQVQERGKTIRILSIRHRGVASRRDPR